MWRLDRFDDEEVKRRYQNAVKSVDLLSALVGRSMQALQEWS